MHETFEKSYFSSSCLSIVFMFFTLKLFFLQCRVLYNNQLFLIIIIGKKLWEKSYDEYCTYISIGNYNKRDGSFVI